MTSIRLPQLLRATERPSLSKQMMRIGATITLIFIAIALLAPLFQALGWLQNPTEFLDNQPHQAPSIAHWFGTTNLGYDVFSRTLFGAQAALQVVILATTLSLIVGVPLGMVSGYLGGRLDRVLIFFMD